MYIYIYMCVCVCVHIYLHVYINMYRNILVHLGLAFFSEAWDFPIHQVDSPMKLWEGWCGTEPCPRQHRLEISVIFSHATYPLVMTNVATENDHRNSEFSHEKW